MASVFGALGYPLVIAENKSYISALNPPIYQKKNPILPVIKTAKRLINIFSSIKSYLTREYFI